MNRDIENRSKELFDEAQEKQVKAIKKILLGVFVSIGSIFAVLGAVFLILEDIFPTIGIVFLPMGLFFIAIGILFYFIIPTKFNYKTYRNRIQKYGMIDIYSIQAKIFELEARIEELENDKKSR